MRILAILSLIFYVQSATVHAEPTRIDRVDAYVAEAMKINQIPGVAIAVIEKGDVIIARGYGMANLEHNIPVTIETMFQSGSTGKQFTAIAVMLLVEDGKLALDDSITKWLPKAPKTWKPITIRHLLNHTAGLPGIDDKGDTHLDLRRDYTDDELAAAAFKFKLLFPPGVRWAYSNDGYDLLGIVIAKASGQFYGDLLKARVFGPLGMKTASVISEEDIIPGRAAGYRVEKGGIKNQEWVAPSHNRSAAGALYLSLKDLIAWDKGLREKTLLKPESWVAIYEPGKLTKGYKAPYGFGWFLAEYASQPHYWHSGGWQGFRAQISRFGPDERTVIVLCNSASCKSSLMVPGIVGALDR